MWQYGMITTTVAAKLVHVYNPVHVAAKLVCSPLMWQ